MQAPNINPAFTGNFVIPNYGNNKKIEYLYNNILDVVKKNQVTSVFSVDKVEINASETQDNKIEKALKKLNLTFFKDNKLIGDKNLIAEYWLNMSK